MIYSRLCTDGLDSIVNQKAISGTVSESFLIAPPLRQAVLIPIGRSGLAYVRRARVPVAGPFSFGGVASHTTDGRNALRTTRWP